MKILWGLQNFFYLLFLNLIDLFFYWRFQGLWKLKLGLFQLYFFSPVFSLIKKESQGFLIPQEELTYGEAPFFTLKQIFQSVGLTAQDHLLDLGSGRGVVVLFANLFLGAKASGIEILPGLVLRSRQLAKFLKVEEKVDFIQADLREAVFPQSTVIFIAGTSFTPETIKILEAKLVNLPPGTRIVSLSFPLQNKNLTLLKKERLYFSWGKGTLFYQQVI